MGDTWGLEPSDQAAWDAGHFPVCARLVVRIREELEPPGAVERQALLVVQAYVGDVRPQSWLGRSTPQATRPTPVAARTGRTIGRRPVRAG